MNKKKIILAGLFLIALSSLVYAATLMSSTPVNKCADSDGGLNYTVRGNTTVSWANGTEHTYNDYCWGVPNHVIEYRCNYADEPITLETWAQDCGEFNMTCSNGRCI